MKKAILIVSFGTTYPDTRQKNIAAITRQVWALYPDAVVEEAVSSTIVRNAMKKREHIEAKSPTEALESMKKQGVTHVAVFPTHVIDGIENHRLKEAAKKYAGAFEQIAVADALLAKPQDYEDVAKALWESLKEEVGDFPLILMGHGTEHAADASYAMMEQSLRAYAKHEIYIATVEGSITIKDVIARMKSGLQSRQNGKVLLTPFMLVAGDHANNDMAGDDDDSWKSQFTASGNFDSVDTQIAGLGEIEAVQKLYVEHTKKAIESLGKVSKSASSSAVSALEDGTYTAKFNTDSGMFHVNEADNGCGTLTVKNGKMTIHIRLVSKKIINLFVGTAADAAKDGAKLLQPTNDTVKYSDGTTEEVYGFDVPVEALDKEFDLAILGTKGTWYDHKVSVSDAQKN